MAHTEPGYDPEELRAAIADLLALPGALLPVLHRVQETFGYVPPESVGEIAHALNLSRAEVQGVISFYHDFRSAPTARHRLKVCCAESCQAMGSAALLQHAERRLGTAVGETSKDGDFTLEPVYCLGNCALSPALMVDGELHGRVSAERFDALIAELSA
jgi:formate dehydrogenase subunit gamma